MDTPPPASRSLQRFAAAIAAMSPRRAVEVATLTLVLGATEGAGLLLLVPLLQLVGVDASRGALGGVAATLDRACRALGFVPTLGSILCAYVAIVGLQAFLQRRHAHVSVALQQAVVTTLRSQLHDAIASMTWVSFSQRRSSDYVHLLTDEVGRVGTAVYYLVDLVVTAATALVYFGFACRVSPAMTLLVLGCAAILASSLRGTMRLARSAGEELTMAWNRVHGAIADHLASLKLAKSYGVEKRHAQDFARLSDNLDAVGRRGAALQANLQQQLAIGSAIVLAAIVYVSHDMLGVSAGQLLLLLFLFARLMPRVTGVYGKAQALAMGLPAFAAVTGAEAQCRAASEPIALPGRAIVLNERVMFQHVSFDYGASTPAPALSDITLSLRARATTAIVGPSGAGKSTLADLLMGLLAPSHGQILIDQTRLTPERRAAWRDEVGYVAQDPFLFHDSVRANLLWAKPDATDPELWNALRLASADAFVSELEHGLETVVGDRGVRVSGGERQRLALARALLRRPSVLILDEATSALDAENEARIRQAIDHLHRQITIVIITHRLSTVRSADTIHVVDGGHLVESGTWRELTARPAGRFRQLCAAQGIDVAVDDRDPSSFGPTSRHLEVLAG